MAGMFFLYPFQKGDVVTLRKTHPCGGTTWELSRVGADVSLVCTTCGHQLILTRRALEKACVKVMPFRDREKD